MASLALSTPATVLYKTERGETGVHLRLLSAEQGMLTAIQRRSTKTVQAHPLADIFDHGLFMLERRALGGGPWYVREFIVERRRPLLANHYESFETACRFATLLDRNAVHVEHHDRLISVLNRALDAWETGTAPQAVLCKALYLLLRDEGHPVKEQWWAELPDGARERAAHLIGTPLDAQTVPPEEAATLVKSLLHWMVGHADYVV
ncbi:MAG: hypothetical protein SFY80_10770 [Verrucomicrobiota bacterium]|nr:hypothetical protein [Verrucomicrobiota bacterium]